MRARRIRCYRGCASVKLVVPDAATKVVSRPKLLRVYQPPAWTGASPVLRPVARDVVYDPSCGHPDRTFTRARRASSARGGRRSAGPRCDDDRRDGRRKPCGHRSYCRRYRHVAGVVRWAARGHSPSSPAARRRLRLIASRILCFRGRDRSDSSPLCPTTPSAHRVTYEILAPATRYFWDSAHPVAASQTRPN